MIETEAIPFNSWGSGFFLSQRHQFTCYALLYSSSFEDELKALSKSLKNRARLYLACPEPGVFLGASNQSESSSGKYEGVSGQTYS